MPRKNNIYSPEFKIQVIEDKIKNNLGYFETAKKNNIFVNINGYEYPNHNIITNWERIYLQEGPDGLRLERRGRGHKAKRKEFLPQVEEDLIAKCQRLEMENEYLKKLDALVQLRELKEKKSQK